MQRRTLLRVCPVLACGLPPALAAWASADGAQDRRQRFQRLVVQAAQADAAGRIEMINVAVNRLIEEAPDPQRQDWRTPGEVLARGHGDCRAFAVLKYFALLAAGHDPRAARVLYTVVRPADTPGLARPHLVAWARAGNAAPRVLDNLNPFALPLALRPDLEPVFSLDLHDLRRGAGEAVHAPASRLRPWRELLERRAREDQSLVWIPTTRPVRGFTSH
ncbi:MAG: transglutaminase-like cysteine peptidase [Piscinibacter sp.]|nr:transglutaminase-like cysteine peptidase [Piscinibacter sp.]